MKLALLLLLAWPWSHVEHDMDYISSDSTCFVRFHKPFKHRPKCKVLAKHPAGVLAYSREGAEFVGAPGDSVDWTCK